MTDSERKSINWLFFIVLVFSALGRFYELGSFSLSNDELSALTRLQVQNFSDLISKGIVATDPHPAGVQVFLYFWTKIFGTSVFFVRLPFVISGLMALYFMFETFKYWFGARSALFSVTTFAVMEFSMIHGQLARPYAMALMAVMAFIWAWTFLIYEGRRSAKYLAVFILSASLSCYFHYYAGLMVGIISLFGLIPAYRHGIFKIYLVSGLMALSLFLPHLQITLAQLSRGSLTSWIPPPEPTFLRKHIFTLLNHSYLLTGLFLLSLFTAIWKSIKWREIPSHFVWFGLVFFLSPIFIGYVYSMYFGAVLMDRVLYFSSPFFFGLMYFKIPRMRSAFYYTLFSILFGLTMLSTAFETAFFQRNYVENFKGLAEDIRVVEGEFPAEDILWIGNFNAAQYLDYYQPKASEHFERSSLQTDQDLSKFMEVVRNSDKTSIAIFWACTYQPIAALEYVRRYFPKLIRNPLYYNSAMWLFQKGDATREVLLDRLMCEDLELGPETEFLEVIKSRRKDLYAVEVLNVSAEFEDIDGDGILLVYAVDDEETSFHDWKGHHLNNFIRQEGNNELFMSFKLPEELSSEAIISIYFWNSRGKSVRVKNVRLTSYEDSHYPCLY
jgi:hypothetical protein